MANKTLNTSLSQSIKLDIPGGEYFLTTYEESDIEIQQEILAIESVSDQLIRVPNPYTLEDAKTWVSAQLASKSALLSHHTIAARNAAFFSLSSDIPIQIPIQVIRHGTKMIGCASLSRATPQVVELGYYLHPAYQGKRIMQEAARKALQYAANEFGVRKVFGTADVENYASQSIIVKLAMESRACGEVERGMLRWPVEKKAEVERESLTWPWRVAPEEGYEFDVKENL